MVALLLRSFWPIAVRSSCFYMKNWGKAIDQHVLQLSAAFVQDETGSRFGLCGDAEMNLLAVV